MQHPTGTNTYSQLSHTSGIEFFFCREDFMAKSKDISLVKNGKDFFVVIDGVRIARRGYPGTPQAGTWVSIEPGWEVVGGPDSFSVTYNRVSVQ
jgi:hypothetical protein